MDCYLRTDQYLVSSNGSFFAIMQNDGNFTVNHGTGPGDNRGNIWHTDRTGAGGEFFSIMQRDGNFVVYLGTGPGDNRGVVWHSESGQGDQFYELLLLDDARLQVQANGEVIWQSDVTATPGSNYRLDQETPKEAGGGMGYDSWQSFTPAFDGHLYRFDLSCTPTGRSGLEPGVTAGISLYRGDGIDDDELIGDAEIVVAQQGPTFHPQEFVIPDGEMRRATLRAGKRYTIRFRPPADKVSVGTTADGAYSRGRYAFFADGAWSPQLCSLVFRTFLRPIPPIWGQGPVPSTDT
jgi:hypothetical protein